jgi:hypothetical protein
MKAGLVTVETITVPGYSSCVAVTSIWQPVEQEIEAGLLEVVLSVELVLGVTVFNIVEGTSSVVVTRTEDTTVDIMVDAGIWLVMICVDPGCVRVLVVTRAGSETVEMKLVVTVLSEIVTVDVKVVSGAVFVIVVVIGGITKVLMMVDKTVLAGSVSVLICVGPGIIDVMTLIEGGSTIVDKDVEIEVETLVTVCSSVLVTTEISTRVISTVVGGVCTEVGPGTVCVGPGTVSTTEMIWVVVLTTEIVVGLSSVIVIISPDTEVVNVVVASDVVTIVVGTVIVESET